MDLESARYRPQFALESRIRRRLGHRISEEATAAPFGPGTRNAISCRSPMMVSDCQSIEWIWVSRIRSRGTPARARTARSKPAAALDIRTLIMGRFQIFDDPGDRSRPRVSAVAKVEHESWIPDGFPAETGSGDITTAQEFFHFSEQMHVFILSVPCDSAAHSFPTQFLLV